MQEKFQALLRQHGRSVTQARLVLFRYLQRRGAVPIKQFLDDNLAVADRASLYRTLLLFKQMGVIEERMTAGRRLVELSDNFDAHHHHLTCNQCGQSRDVTMPDIEHLLQVVCARANFQLRGHVIEVDGVCMACQPHAAPSA